MREILFRGKRVKSGKWEYGSLVDTYEIYSKKQHCFIADSDYDDHEEIEVIPETVGQYTGLTDKNGTKIFEGDILGGFCDMQIEIYYDEQCCQFRAREKGGFNQPIDYYCGFPIRFEVIGNIYDNREI